MTTYAIIDLDNCTSDDRWRRHYRDTGPNFHNYHSRAPWDKLANDWVFIRAKRNVIVTGRPVLYRPATEEWLRRNRINYHRLIMRPHDDVRPSVLVKKTFVELFIQEEEGLQRSDIIMAADDQDAVIEAYRSLDLPTFTVRIDEDTRAES